MGRYRNVYGTKQVFDGPITPQRIQLDGPKIIKLTLNYLMNGNLRRNMYHSNTNTDTNPDVNTNPDVDGNPDVNPNANTHANTVGNADANTIRT